MIFNFVNYCNEGHREKFIRDGILYMNNFVEEESQPILKATAKKLLDDVGKRKDFLMSQTENSPRFMKVVNGNALKKINYINSSYNCHNLRMFLNYVTDTTVINCSNLIEDMIITRLQKEMDTHGWHKDDYPYALIVGIESSPSCGGLLEYRNNEGQICSFYLKEGDAYLMRTDKIQHRVSPLINNTPRTILNFTYGIKEQKVIKNGTATQLLS